MSTTAKWQLLLLTLLLGGVIYLLAPVLTPFAVAALFAYLGDPWVDALERRGIGRTWAVSLVFALFILGCLIILLILAPLLERQITRLLEQLPLWIGYVQEAILPRIERSTGMSLERLDAAALLAVLRQHWQEAGGLAQSVVGGLSRSGMTLMVWLANLLLLPVLVFYLLRDWDILVERVRELLPRAIEPTVSRLARESDEVLGAFLRGQLSVMLALGTIYSTGLMLVGLDLGLLIGMLAGLVSFIPYLGAIVGIGAGVIAALVQHGDLLHVVLVLVVFGIGQVVESFVLTPWLVGDRIGLHPVAVIFAIMAGGQLFGFFGVLLALPVAAVVMVLLRYAHERYLASHLYAGEEAPARGVAGVGTEVDVARGAPTPESEPGPSSTAAQVSGAPKVDSR